MPECKNCDKKFPNKIKIDGKWRNTQRRKYCLDCSPFGEHNTKQIHILEQRGLIYRCNKCGETDPNKFYGHKRAMCGKCQNAYAMELGKAKRLRAITYLGAKCIECGYDKYTPSIDFHHRDPSTKDKDFQAMRGWKWERILNEIKKCILLCKNCHAAYHSGLMELKIDKTER